MNRPVIYTIGDSHALHAWCKIPNVVANSIGPMLMYSFGIGKNIFVDRFPSDSAVVFSWGEIDCRCHVHRHGPWKENVDGLVSRYLEALDENAKVNPNILIYNVVPPVHKDSTHDNPAYPFFRTDLERLDYVRYMNLKLKEQTKYPVIDVYDKYADEEGFLNLKYSDYHVHIEDPIFIIEWLENFYAYKK